MDLGVIRKPTVFDVVNIIRNVRQADRDEAYLFAGKTIQQALEETPDLYRNSLVWEWGGKIACIYGVTPTADPDKWTIWLLATDEFDKNKKAARIQCMKLFKELIEGKVYLFNYVHSKHVSALKWVKWLGFQVGNPEPIGLNGEEFCKIEVINV